MKEVSLIALKIYEASLTKVRFELIFHTGESVKWEIEVSDPKHINTVIKQEIDRAGENIAVMANDIEFAYKSKKEIEYLLNGAPSDIIREKALDECASCHSKEQFDADLIRDDAHHGNIWYECSCDKCGIKYTIHIDLVGIDVDSVGPILVD